ncbi:hypothetical protein CLV48_102403 [Cecembia rubra]|uniref:Uncharacterized protein n=1 Tax=Cecembia rubra TaxID=1485585 RepID=A0A2P8EAU3_9BACT|nr:hypothetical protein CLV48_102403 [Cecembia rubra]
MADNFYIGANLSAFPNCSFATQISEGVTSEICSFSSCTELPVPTLFKVIFSTVG